MNNLNAGTRNLLHESMGLLPGQRVLLVLEPDAETLYNADLANHLAAAIRAEGAELRIEKPELVDSPDRFPQALVSAMQSTDHSLFLSRIGDYSRFRALPGSGKSTMCYATSLQSLASGFGSVSHRLMSELHQELEGELQMAKRWRITCQRGTSIEGTFSWPGNAEGDDEDFSLSLFPVSTFKPVPCSDATGRVALSRWLMPGAAPKLDSAMVRVDQVAFANVASGALTGVSGGTSSARLVNDHYDYVSGTLGINRNRVHSWHVGMNPFTQFDAPVDDNLESWSAISFASPRYLHFHTCGDQPPGEVTWSVFDPTILIDEIPFWQMGQFVWLQRADNRRLFLETPGAAALLDVSGDIGVSG